MSSRNNTFAALDNEPDQEEKWGETTAPASFSDVRPSRNNQYNGNEQPKKVRFVTLREAVSRSFNRHPGIFGHAFDKQRPMIPQDEWDAECDCTNEKYDVVELEQARTRLDSYYIMEESLALSFVTPFVVDGLFASMKFYETKLNRARELYQEALDAANSRH